MCHMIHLIKSVVRRQGQQLLRLDDEHKEAAELEGQVSICLLLGFFFRKLRVLDDIILAIIFAYNTDFFFRRSLDTTF